MKTYRNGLTSKECDTPGGGEVITKQDGKAAADINNILANFKRTGELTSLNQKEPQFGDFSQAIEYDQALALVRQTEAAFATWPSELREAARNDPSLALHMLADEGGRALLEQNGFPVKTDTEKSPLAQPSAETPATN